MSLLLHILGKVIFFSVLAVVVLTVLTWLTKNPKSNQTAPPSGEWPEDKAKHIERISARRPRLRVSSRKRANRMPRSMTPLVLRGTA